MCHSDPAKNASPTPVIPPKSSCFAATVTPYGFAHDVYDDGGAHGRHRAKLRDDRRVARERAAREDARHTARDGRERARGETHSRSNVAIFPRRPVSVPPGGGTA